MTKSRAQATGGGVHPVASQEERETRKRAGGETLCVIPFRWLNPACVLVP